MLLRINLRSLKNQEDWTVTGLCRDLVAAKSEVTTIECHRDGELAYTVTDVAHMATLEPRGEGGWKTYRRKPSTSSVVRLNDPSATLVA